MTPYERSQTKMQVCYGIICLAVEPERLICPRKIKMGVSCLFVEWWVI